MASDTSGHLLTRVACGFALTGLAFVLLVPLVSPVDPEIDPEGELGGGERVTLVEREGSVAALAALGLAAASVAPLFFRGTAMFKTVQRLSAATLVVGVLMSITLVGLFFIPSAVLMVGAASRRAEDHPLRPRGF